MSSVKRADRVLRFAVGGALLTTPVLAGGCDDKPADPTANEGPTPEPSSKDDGGESDEKIDDGKVTTPPKPVEDPITNEGQILDPEPVLELNTNPGRAPDE